MRFGARIGLAVAAVATLAAKPPPRPEPRQLSETFACAALPDAAARLACFDKAVATLRSAYASSDLLVVDREGIRRAKRSLFGLSLPSLDIFSGDKADREDNEITVKLVSAGFQPNGTLGFTTDAGGSWVQADDVTLPSLPKPGAAVTIRRAALGSFSARIGNQSFRVKRVN
jgi:hypothetical protein